MSQHVLSLLVEDRPGLLTRVAGLFARRGFNSESLAVGTTEVEGLSRLFIYGIDSSCAAPSLASLRICVYDGAANKVASWCLISRGHFIQVQLLSTFAAVSTVYLVDTLLPRAFGTTRSIQRKEHAPTASDTRHVLNSFGLFIC